MSAQLCCEQGGRGETARNSAGALEGYMRPAFLHMGPGSLTFTGNSLPSPAVLVPLSVSLTHYLSSRQASPLPDPAIGLLREDIVAQRASL